MFWKQNTDVSTKIHIIVYKMSPYKFYILNLSLSRQNKMVRDFMLLSFSVCLNNVSLTLLKGHHCQDHVLNVVSAATISEVCIAYSLILMCES